MSPRTILHVDLDAFFCSVEEQFRPELKGKPFIVAGRPETRGVVSSASYAARKHGVRSAMPTAQALRLCPNLMVVSPRHHTYGEISDQVIDLLRQSAPLVEQLSIDEAFLDVSDDPRPGSEVAAVLKARVLHDFGLPSSWGVASNKLVAKIATNVGKPDGLVVVPAGSEAAFLRPLPSGMLWGVGPKTRARLAQFGVTTIGQLADLPSAVLAKEFGAYGTELAARARGEDPSLLVEHEEPRSMSSETTFPSDVSEDQVLRRTLLEISEELGSRLREAGFVGSTVRLKLRWPDFRTVTRQTKLAHPTDQDREIFEAGWRLFEETWQRRRPVRLIGLAVTDLDRTGRQLELFDHSWQEDRALLRAVDAIRAKYGWDALQRGTSLAARTPTKRRQAKE